jgi:hypothetical protein
VPASGRRSGPRSAISLLQRRGLSEIVAEAIIAAAQRARQLDQ